MVQANHHPWCNEHSKRAALPLLWATIRYWMDSSRKGIMWVVLFQHQSKWNNPLLERCLYDHQDLCAWSMSGSGKGSNWRCLNHNQSPHAGKVDVIPFARMHAACWLPQTLPCISAPCCCVSAVESCPVASMGTSRGAWMMGS